MNKKKIINFLICLLIIFATILIFNNSSEVSTNFFSTLLYIVKIIVPSLFPFMIFINFLLISNAIDYISIIFKPFGKIFNLSGYGITCIIASILGGYPYSAILASTFMKEKKISINEGKRLILCMFFPSFSFLFVLLKGMDFNFIYIILSLYLASFVMLYFTKFIYKTKLESKQIDIILNDNYSKMYFDVMESTFKSIFTIAFCILFFNILSTIIDSFISNRYLNITLRGLLEFSSASIEILNYEKKSLLDYFLLNNIISFASFSILFQTMYYLDDKCIKIKKVIIYRLITCLISSFILLLLYLIFKQNIHISNSVFFHF